MHYRPAPQTTAPNLEHGDMFGVLVAVLREAGATIALAELDDDAAWDADSATLTLRADAETSDHTWALAEFCRHLTPALGPTFSRFIATAPARHLYALS